MRTSSRIIDAYITIQRPDGAVDNVPTTADGKPIAGVFGSTDHARNILPAMRDATRNAGRGNIISATLTLAVTTSNIDDLIRDYNDAVNEGGEGYIPDNAYFKKLKQYTETTQQKTEIIRL